MAGLQTPSTKLLTQSHLLAYGVTYTLNKHTCTLADTCELIHIGCYNVVCIFFIMHIDFNFLHPRRFIHASCYSWQGNAISSSVLTGSLKATFVHPYIHPFSAALQAAVIAIYPKKPSPPSPCPSLPGNTEEFCSQPRTNLV